MVEAHGGCDAKLLVVFFVPDDGPAALDAQGTDRDIIAEN